MFLCKNFISKRKKNKNFVKKKIKNKFFKKKTPRREKKPQVPARDAFNRCIILLESLSISRIS